MLGCHSGWPILFLVVHGPASLGRILQRSLGLGSLLEASRDRSGGHGRALCWGSSEEDIACVEVCGLRIAFLKRRLFGVLAF